MKLGVTIVGQMITFAILVWFTMRFIWPVLVAVLEERKKKIADGLAAAEQGHVILSKARDEAHTELKRALLHREEILSQANKNAAKIIEDARHEAKIERDDIIRSGKVQIEHELLSARSKLIQEMSGIIIAGTEKILGRSVKEEDHSAILTKMMQQYGRN